MGRTQVTVSIVASAIAWAKRIPFQEGVVEIRPLFELSDFPVDPAEHADGWREKEEQMRAAPPARKLSTQRYLGLLKADPDVSNRLNEAQLNELFDLGYHYKHVDTIFDRVFGRSA